MSLPRLEPRNLEHFIQPNHSHALDIDFLTMGLDRDRCSIFMFPNIVAFHPEPMAPRERNGWWARVDFEDFPGKVGYHVAECEVAVFELAMLGSVVFIWGDDCGVRSSEGFMEVCMSVIT